MLMVLVRCLSVRRMFVLFSLLCVFCVNWLGILCIRV